MCPNPKNGGICRIDIFSHSGKMETKSDFDRKGGSPVISIAIVEDEKNYIDQLTAYLKRYEEESGHRLRLSVFRDGGQILNNYRAEYDIILMDIQMQLIDGMTAAERIRRVDPDTIIIFITNMVQYAIRGYAVDALDYVLKPVSYFAFSQRIDRAIDRLKRKEKHFVMIATRGGSQKLPTDQIYYVESNGHALTYYAKNDVLTATGTMKEVEQALKAHGFSRCNKGYIVNLEHVQAIRNGAVLVAGQELLISRGRKAEFMEDLARHMGGSSL